MRGRVGLCATSHIACIFAARFINTLFGQAYVTTVKILQNYPKQNLPLRSLSAYIRYKEKCKSISFIAHSINPGQVWIIMTIALVHFVKYCEYPIVRIDCVFHCLILQIGQGNFMFILFYFFSNLHGLVALASLSS